MKYPNEIILANGLKLTSVKAVEQSGRLSFAQNTWLNWIVSPLPDRLKDPLLFSTSVDWNGNDPVAQSVRQMQRNLDQRVRESGILQKLHKQPRWDKVAREAWEAELSRLVSEEVASDPLLANYRTSPEVRRTQNLNQLKTNTSFDCVTMSMVEGRLLQSLEDQWLGDRAPSDASDLRRPSQYYIAAGFTRAPDPENTKTLTGGGHAFLVSSLTGAVIESTQVRGVPYRKSVHSDYGFNDMLAGYSFVGTPVKIGNGKLEFAITSNPVAATNTIYNVGFEGTPDSVARINARSAAIEKGDFRSLSDLALDIISESNWFWHRFRVNDFEQLRYTLRLRDNTKFHKAADLKFKDVPLALDQPGVKRETTGNPLSQAILAADQKDFSLGKLFDAKGNAADIFEVNEWLRKATVIAKTRESLTTGWDNATVKAPEKTATAVAGWCAGTVTYSDGRKEPIVANNSNDLGPCR